MLELHISYIVSLLSNSSLRLILGIVNFIKNNVLTEKIYHMLNIVDGRLCGFEAEAQLQNPRMQTVLKYIGFCVWTFIMM